MVDHAFTPGRTSLPAAGDDLAGPGGQAPGKRTLTDGVSPTAQEPTLFTGARWEAIDPDEAADHDGDLLAFAGGAPEMSAAPAAPAPAPAAPAPAPAPAPAKPADAKAAAPAKPKVAPVTKAKSFKEYVVKPANPRSYDPLAGKQTLGGTDLAAVNTQAAEAKVLNALRQKDKRFNAAALIVAQQNLGVANATGAFNTETLRQLKAKTGDARLSEKDPQVAAAAIVDESLWKPYHTAPGVELFFAAVDGDGGKKTDRTATRRADRVAQAMGYESYKTYSGQLKKFTFLGVKPADGKDKAHPHLIARLQAAEAFLKQRHGDDVTPAKIGWQGGLVGTYHTDENQIEKGTAHFHTMGLAVDFDPSINGYLYPQSDLKSQTITNMQAKNKEIEERNKNKKPDEALEELFDAHGIATEWVKQSTNFMDVAFTQAGYLFSAVVLTKAKMMEWSNTLSTEELHARIASAAAALKQYIDLAKSGTDKAIIDRFVAAGFTEAQAREALPEMRKFPERYNGGFSRKHTNGLPTTHSLDLMVALRDVAGLTFGGSEMSHGDNGDFMHFDCRNDPLGQRARAEMT
jgi:hypothetical protein